VKYRVRSDLIFEKEEDSTLAFEYLKKMRNLFLTINKGKPNEERSMLEIHKCYHDELEPKPCESIERIESE